MTAVLGLIPARGGSKRIPRKNIRPFAGQPLMAWTINAAHFASTIDRVVVSSEDQEIIETARNYGAQVVRRPADLATDKADSYGLILHALDKLETPFDFVALLQPTSPFRASLDIDAAVYTAMVNHMPVVTVRPGENVPNGAVYVAPVQWLREALASGQTHPFDGPAPLKVYMPYERSDDIDTLDDWERAEARIQVAA